MWFFIKLFSENRDVQHSCCPLFFGHFPHQVHIDDVCILMYVGGVRWGELAVMKCMHGEHWGEQWWLKPPHTALFPTWLPAVVHRTSGAQLDLTERDASSKRQNGQGGETGGFKTEPWSIYLFICSHLMFIFPLCWEKTTYFLLHIFCVSVLRVWSHWQFIQH